MVFKTLTIIATALLFFTGCSGVNVIETPLKQTIIPPEDADPSPIALNRVRVHLKTGSPVASNSPKGLLGLLNCSLPYGQIGTNITSRTIDRETLESLFYDTLEAQGYDVTGNPGRLFDIDEDLQRTLFAIGGTIKDVKIDGCAGENIWGVHTGFSGEGSVTVEWTVYDRLHKRHLYKTTSTGYAKLRHKTYDGLLLLLEEAFAASAHNFGADETFHNLIFYGTKPPKKHNYDPLSDATGIYDPQEKVDIRKKPHSTKPAKNRFEDIIKTTVTLEGGAGHGSGFFVTDQGHILTNAHVTGHAKRLRVTTSKNKKKLIAEVLRVDRKRDVALLKLEKIPEKFKIQTLPIQTKQLKIGEDIYAIGSPYDDRLRDTVTKGIVSAYRYYKLQKHWSIQGDAFVYFGNSGGPLLDKNGNIVGITYAGYLDEGDLNLFIPIADALDKLEITLGGKPVSFTPPK